MEIILISMNPLYIHLQIKMKSEKVYLIYIQMETEMKGTFNEVNEADHMIIEEQIDKFKNEITIEDSTEKKVIA